LLFGLVPIASTQYLGLLNIAQPLLRIILVRQLLLLLNWSLLGLFLHRLGLLGLRCLHDRFWLGSWHRLLLTLPSHFLDKRVHSLGRRLGVNFLFLLLGDLDYRGFFLDFYDWLDDFNLLDCRLFVGVFGFPLDFLLFLVLLAFSVVWDYVLKFMLCLFFDILAGEGRNILQLGPPIDYLLLLNHNGRLNFGLFLNRTVEINDKRLCLRLLFDLLAPLLFDDNLSADSFQLRHRALMAPLLLGRLPLAEARLLEAVLTAPVNLFFAAVVRAVVFFGLENHIEQVGEHVFVIL